MAATSKGRRTETAFHDAARAVFAEKGYFETTIGDIARRAERSAGSFYNYHESKQHLLEALLEKFTTDVVDRAEQHTSDDPRDNIEAAVRAYFRTYRDYLPEMIGAFHLSMTDPRFAQWWLDRREQGMHAILRVVRSVEKRGHDIDIDRRVFASAMVSMVESFCWTWFATAGDSLISDRDEDVAVETLSAIFRRSLYNTN